MDKSGPSKECDLTQSDIEIMCIDSDHEGQFSQDCDDTSQKKISVCKRTFHHVNIENFINFLSEEKNIRIVGVKQIIEAAGKNPFKAALENFLFCLKHEYNTIIDKAKLLPQHETQKMETFVEKEFFLLQTKKDLHSEFAKCLQSLKIGLHTETDTTSNTDHQYGMTDSNKMTKSLPLITPCIPSASTQTIPIIHFDDLPISDVDSYYLILSTCAYFWSIIKWPITEKDVEFDIDIENMNIKTVFTTQEKEHNMHYFGWVIMDARKYIMRMSNSVIKISKNNHSNEECVVNKENVIKLLNLMGEDVVKDQLASGAPSYQYQPKHDVFQFFMYLASCSIKLLDSTVMDVEKTNTVNFALQKISTCKTLRKHFFDMLEKCGTIPETVSKADKIYLLSILVEKHMHSRQKIELKRHHLHPQKMSSATRSSLKAKCSNTTNNTKKKGKTEKHDKKSTKKIQPESTTEDNTTNEKHAINKTENNKVTNIPVTKKQKQNKTITTTNEPPAKKQKIQNTNESVNTEKKNDYVYESLREKPELLIGKKIKHKWNFKKKSMFLQGKVIGLTKKGILPEDSDTDERQDETCFDVQYTKYKTNIYHYRILPDLKSGDLQILLSDNDC